MYICMYIYIHVFIYINIYMYICMYIYIYICACMYVCVYIYIYMSIYMCVYICNVYIVDPHKPPFWPCQTSRATVAPLRSPRSPWNASWAASSSDSSHVPRPGSAGSGDEKKLGCWGCKECIGDVYMYMYVHNMALQCIPLHCTALRYIALHTCICR